MIELIVFIIIVSVGVAGILSVINTVVKSSADPMVRKQAIAMAEAVLEEVITKEYQSPAVGDYSGTDRNLWDDVDDYNGKTINGADMIGGASGLGLAGYNAIVTITPTTLTGVTTKKVVVSVTGGGNTIDLFGYRTNY